MTKFFAKGSILPLTGKILGVKRVLKVAQCHILHCLRSTLNCGYGWKKLIGANNKVASERSGMNQIKV